MRMSRGARLAAACLPGRGVEGRARRRGQAPADPPPRPREGQVGQRGKAQLVAPQRQEQVRQPIAGREAGIGRAHAVAVHPPPTGPDQKGSGFPHEPYAELPGLEHEPGAGVQLACPVVDEVAEQTERHLLGSAALGAGRLEHPSAPGGVQLGDRPGVDEAEQGERDQHRSGKPEHPGRNHERHRVGGGRKRPQPPGAAQRALVGAPAPVNVGELRKGAVGFDRRERTQG